MLYLPKAVATVIGIKYGDAVDFLIEGNEVIVRKSEAGASSEEKK
jgi:bifunctional DNA-binding transcriptional regulator/antitoxin component of YhaV-PrlF toxin-antitoxin module